MEIPVGQLSSQALEGIIEEFITREGTEYGLVEKPLQLKIAEVMAQIEAGKVVIRYDTASQSCSLFLKE
ncbi:MAG: YheU family protein [Magnetococcales bacterium]|nr:YheU family protein [Magnetococcales bacterium]